MRINQIFATDFIDNFNVKEWDMYGSSRIGIKKPVGTESNYSIGFSATYSGLNFHSVVYGTPPASFNCTDGCLLTRTLGKKEFEITNHLGNVLETVTDIHLPNGSASSHTVDYYTSDVIGYSDYFVFGAPMPGRNASSSSYKYGFGGQEKDDEIFGSSGTCYTAEFWQYDSRLGRRWNVDPKDNASVSVYACFFNNPIGYTDVKGDSSVWDTRGYQIYYDPNDLDTRVFILGLDGKQTLVGRLGGTINANPWFKNLLIDNSKEADDLWDPSDFRDFVKKNGKWDYKNRNESNPNKSLNNHLLGIAFYRQSVENKAETYFYFDKYVGKAADLNNLHFGVVGKAYGFTEEVMLRLAGQAEMQKWQEDYHKEVPAEWRPMQISIKYDEYGFPVGETQLLLAPYGDNPRDAEYIKYGFEYYNNHREELDGDWW